jgi:hypothetical protein
VKADLAAAGRAALPRPARHPLRFGAAAVALALAIGAVLGAALVSWPRGDAPESAAGTLVLRLDADFEAFARRVDGESRR